MASLLMIGGTGVLSSAMTAEALKRGYSVTLINRGHHPPPAGVKSVIADKNDYPRIAEGIKGCKFDAVIDFLCYTADQLRVSFSFYSSYTHQYVFVSSCAVYAPKQTGEIAEDSPKPNSIWKYSVDKWACEVELHKLAKNSQCRYTVIRPAVTYGNTRIPYGISPRYGYHWTLVARVLAGKPILTWDGGFQKVLALRVEDFSVGAIGLIGKEQAFDEAFNVCADNYNTQMEILDVISKFIETPIIICDVPSDFYASQVPNRAGEILGGRTQKKEYHGWLSNKKLKEVVPEFRQNISLQDGIRMTLEAYKTHKFQNGIDWEFDGETDRVVEAWCRYNGWPTNRFKIGFVDYFASARLFDRYRYWRSFKRDSILGRLAIGGWRLVRKFN